MKTVNEDFILIDTRKSKQNKTTFILPNGYGALSYIHTLSKKISNDYGKVIIPILSGQNERVGILNVESAKDDFERIFIKTTLNYKRKINIICHCSSLLYLSEVRNKDVWNKVNKIILYSFLAEPKKHFTRFKEKAKEFGININNKEFDNLDKFDNIDIYKNIPVPIYVIHPNTLMNRFRASKSDLLELEKLPNVKSVITPLKGYDIKDIPQIEEINNIVDICFKPLL